MSTTHARIPVLRWHTPDPRKPWFKDYVLACGHVLVHRPLRRGSDGRLHVARCMPCPLCAKGGPPLRKTPSPTGEGRNLSLAPTAAVMGLVG